MIHYNLYIILELLTAANLAIGVTLSLLLYTVVYFTNLLLIAPRFDPLNNLAGPDGTGHMFEVNDPQVSARYAAQWAKEYGKSYRFYGLGYFDPRLMTTDIRALKHIIQSPIYEKPWQTRRVLTNVIGRGIFAMEGEVHKIQRSIIDPAFAPAHIKALYPIFIKKAEELRARWEGITTSQDFGFTLPPPANSPADGSASEAAAVTFDVMDWLTRATFDVMGLAGFDHHFNAIKGEHQPVYSAFKQLFGLATDDSLGFVARLFFPKLDKLMPDARVRLMDASKSTIRSFGEDLISRKREKMADEACTFGGPRDRDLLSLLMQANINKELPILQRLTDQELMDQISTFLFAGSDSTSVIIAWSLYYLAQHQDIQPRLREELKSIPFHTPPASFRTQLGEKGEYSAGPVVEKEDGCNTDAHDAEFACPDFDVLNALPLLNGVVRETMRLTPPVHATIRAPTRDDVIPTEETVRMRDGSLATHGIRIKKGSMIHFPIEALNLSMDIWGPDALEFAPDRWSNLPSSAGPHLGNEHLYNFSFGSHACPGKQFALLEAKSFLAVLVRDFAFTPATRLQRRNDIIVRPVVKGHPDAGVLLPLQVRRLNVEER